MTDHKLGRRCPTERQLVLEGASPPPYCRVGELSDFELLGAWRSGQSSAGEALVGRHAGCLRRFLRRRAGDLAEDLLQETLLVTVLQRDSFQGRSSFRTYLFGIARRILRRSQQQLEGHPSGADPAADTDSIALDPCLDQVDYEILVDAILKLCTDDQVMIRQYFWDGLTGTEIGESLGVSERAIRSRLRRTLARLRKAYLAPPNERELSAKSERSMPTGADPSTAASCQQ